MILRTRIRFIAIAVCAAVFGLPIHRAAVAAPAPASGGTHLSTRPQQEDKQKPKEPEKRKKEEEEKKKKEGGLNEFEEEATGEKADTDTDAEPAGDTDLDSGWWACCGEFGATVLLGGGVISWVRVHGTDDPELQEIGEPRQLGEPVTPFVTVDVVYQNVISDITAVDGRVEVGYGPGGIQFRETHYEENDPYDRLDLIQWHVLYRMAFSRYVGVDLGLGSNIVRGDGTNSGFSITLPIRIQPITWVGAQFRPNVSSIKGNSINDFDLGMTVGPRWLYVRGGYRWLKAGSASLNGPYAGLTFSF